MKTLASLVRQKHGEETNNYSKKYYSYSGSINNKQSYIGKNILIMENNATTIINILVFVFV